MALTGENFIRVNRNNTPINRLKEELQNAKIDFTDYAKSKGNYYNIDENEFNYDVLYKKENRVKRLEYLLYNAEEADRMRRIWK